MAQGQGISLLVRAHQEAGNDVYLSAAKEAFYAFNKDVKEGGVVYTDNEGYKWFEEYIVSPPTHILNGFIWASWGVYDYWLATGEPISLELFNQAVQTLSSNLYRYDIGFWSLYEQSGTWLKMIASTFYHHLHIGQLKILYRITGDEIFRRYATKWEGYRRSKIKRAIALPYKIIFKICYY